MAEVRAKGPIPFGAVTNYCGRDGSRGERDSAQHLSKAGLAEGVELLLSGHSGIGVIQCVLDHHQAIRVRALVAASANRRSDGPEGDITPRIEAAGSGEDITVPSVQNVQCSESGGAWTARFTYPPAPLSA